MDTITRFLTGRHSSSEIRWHLAALAVGYWGLVFCAWLAYPAEHKYSIMKDTLSSLGSFDSGRNPDWYWLFSIAMVYCGLVMIPVMLYIRRSLEIVSELGAWMGSVLFLSGCVMITLTGLFPDAHGRAIGNLGYNQIHGITAGLIGVTFSLGVLWHGALLIWDKFTQETFTESGTSPYLRLSGPFSVLLVVLATIGYKVRWDCVYSALWAVLHTSGREAMNDLSLAFRGLQTYPFLEHVSIWALTVFVIWFAAALPSDVDLDLQ